MHWHVSHRADPRARALADRHYNRQHIGAVGFVPPGRCLVYLTANAGALWVTSWPFKEYVKHAWGGAWINTLFRRESGPLASLLIRDGVAATRMYWTPPPLGMVTFINPAYVRPKQHLGRCYLEAGFRPARCPVHGKADGETGAVCLACRSRTIGGLYAVQMLPHEMPPAEPAHGAAMVLAL